MKVQIKKDKHREKSIKYFIDNIKNILLKIFD